VHKMSHFKTIFSPHSLQPEMHNVELRNFSFKKLFRVVSETA
jgi:tRNA A22 N-methylase